GSPSCSARRPLRTNGRGDVARGFLDKLLGRPAPPPDVAEALAELTRFAADRPSFAGPAAVLSDLLPGLAEPAPNITRPAIPFDRAAAKLAGGVPLLRGESVPFDARLLRRRWAEVCTAVGRHQIGDAAAALADAAKRGRLAVEELA